MAELIDRNVLYEQMTDEYKKHYAGTGKGYDFTIAMQMVQNQPTVTEAEIRAKAISDFLKALEELTKKNWIDHLEYGITWADLESVAEQLKECE